MGEAKRKHEVRVIVVAVVVGKARTEEVRREVLAAWVKRELARRVAVTERRG